MVGMDMFNINNNNYLCIIDNHNNFPIIKKTGDLLADNLTLACKITFSEYKIPKRIMSDAGRNFISEKFKSFCKSLNIEQAVSSSYHHQSNGQGEACIKFVKYMLKMF